MVELAHITRVDIALRIDERIALSRALLSVRDNGYAHAKKILTLPLLLLSEPPFPSNNHQPARHTLLL